MTDEMNKWLKQQLCSQDTPNDEEAPKRPFKDIRVTTEPVPGKPYCWRGQLRMIPQMRLMGVEAELAIHCLFDPSPA